MPKLFNKILIVTSLSVLAQAMGSNLPLSISTFGPQGSSSAPSSATSFLSQSVPVMASTTATQSNSLATANDEKKESKEEKKESKEERKRRSNEASTDNKDSNDKRSDDKRSEPVDKRMRVRSDDKEEKKTSDLQEDELTMTTTDLIKYGCLLMYTDSKRAVALFTQAYEKGDADAAYWLGVCCEEGIGMTKEDETKAPAYYRKALAIDKNHAVAMNALGLWLQIHGKQEDAKEALECYKKAAAQDNLDAICNLGECYFSGCLGVSLDLKKAFESFEQAAEKNHLRAMYSLALCYECGYGTEENEELAGLWYANGAEAGDVHAMYELGMSYFKGTCGFARNTQKALAWFKKAAEFKDDHSLIVLSYCFKHGIGVKKDTSWANELLRRAAVIVGNDDSAKDSLKSLEQDSEGIGSGVPIDCYNQVCSICFNKFITGQAITYLCCEHKFHEACMTPWLQGHNTCPICRGSTQDFVLATVL